MAVSRVSQSTIKQGLDKSKNFVAGIPPILGRLDSIYTFTASANVSTVVINNIPQNYKHLHLRCVLVGGTNTIGDGREYFWDLAINDSSTVYAHWLRATNGNVASSNSAQTYIGSSYRMNTSASTSVYAASIIDILDYTNTSKNIVIKSFSGGVNPDSIYGTLDGVSLLSGLRIRSAPTTSITILDTVGAGIGPNSKIALYGVK